jgi:hypothetical protein
VPEETGADGNSGQVFSADNSPADWLSPDDDFLAESIVDDLAWQQRTDLLFSFAEPM